VSTNQLDPQLRTVNQLFDDDDVVYTVPIYQRNFSWVVNDNYFFPLTTIKSIHC